VKEYGPQRAVDEISFSIGKGEIVGFLGPNGAGKSTTMKMLTCFIPPTSGHASVAGLDIQEDSIPLRRKVGYLAEHNPLYLDMYVKEYLSFVARLHKLSSIPDKVNRMIEITGLQREKHKPLSALSKGYRQRVGLAQAMIHDPEVLILDEPTSGLDPNQLVEIRELISSMGKDKTVLFSSHIMQEVQALCDRVIIINQGKIVADESMEALGNRMQGVVVCACAFQEKVSQEQLLRIPGAFAADQKGSYWNIKFKTLEDPRADIFNWSKDHSFTLIHLEKVSSSLESVFQELTRVEKEV
jgi:ABC-2 type transport system ATP-binding protein